MKPYTPRKFKQRIRQELYYIEKFGLEDHSDRSGYRNIQTAVNVISGKVRYLKYIEPNLGTSIHKKWSEILNNYDLRESYSSRIKHYETEKVAFMFFDESEIQLEDQTSLLILCCVLLEDYNIVTSLVENIHDEILSDPYILGRRNRIRRALHWTDLQPAYQFLFIREINTMPITSFIAYKTLSSSEDYKEAYLELVKQILTQRFKTNNLNSTLVSVTFEENSKIKETNLKSITNNILLKKRTNELCPRDIFVSIKAKQDEICLSLPDAILGSFRKYLTLDKSKRIDDGNHITTHFLSIREKIKVIYDRNTYTDHTRHNTETNPLPFYKGAPLTKKTGK